MKKERKPDLGCTVSLEEARRLMAERACDDGDEVTLP